MVLICIFQMISSDFFYNPIGLFDILICEVPIGVFLPSSSVACTMILIEYVGIYNISRIQILVKYMYCQSLLLVTCIFTVLMMFLIK